MLLRTNAPELAMLLQSQEDGGVTQPVMMATTGTARKRGEAAQASGESREGSLQESQEVGPERPESDVVERSRG